MGGSSSKPATTSEVPIFDSTKLTAQLPDIEEYEDKVKATFDSMSGELNMALAGMSGYQSAFNTVGWLFLLCLILYVSYYYIYPWIVGNMPKSISIPKAGKDLSITSAMIGSKDVKQKVIDRVAGNELHIQVDSMIDAAEGDNLVVTYQYPGEVPGSITVPYGKPIDIAPASQPTSDGQASSWWNSKNLMATAKDAKEVSTVSVPDNGAEGVYGYQFWMYVTDWNYKYGEEKNIMFRPDATNSAIKNPTVTLHPTDNSMKISVSIFPSNSDSSKTEPAPAGHSGSTDDVYICEVPNIPLQTWLSVGITVSTRNLDVYLNGNLVKSCFLSGVPKPVSGSVTLNADGGFSGWMCGFYHYDKMLVPSDAQAFYGSGVPCSVPGTSTNYNVTFGINDAKGEVVSKYMF
jgi:hypothetical protein